MSILNRGQIKCPVCGKKVLGYYEICDCGWQNDPIQTNDPDYKGGANEMSLNEAKKVYDAGTKEK